MIDELRKQATELGITFDKRWGEKRLQKEIEQATAPEVGEPEPEPVIKPEVIPDQRSIRNKTERRYYAGLVCFVPCGDVALTPEQMADESTMKRLANMVRIGDAEWL